jgi:hypothetical protein
VGDHGERNYSQAINGGASAGMAWRCSMMFGALGKSNRGFVRLQHQMVDLSENPIFRKTVVEEKTITSKNMIDIV